MAVIRELREVLLNSFFPIEEVSNEAIKEKKGRSPTFEMHFWWGRKPLIVSRAAILGMTLGPEDRHDFLEQLGLKRSQKDKIRAFNISPDLAELNKRSKPIYGKDQLTILDPFAGGGSIPYEALRLGHNVIANDYNPVSWLILMTSIYYPKRLGFKLYRRVEEAYLELIERISSNMGKFYQSTGDLFTSTYLFAWKILCPHCKELIPLVNNWILKKKPINKDPGNFNWTYMVPSFSQSTLKIKIEHEVSQKTPKNLQGGTIIRGKGICLNCKNSISNPHIVSEIKNRRLEVPLAVVKSSNFKKGKFYFPFDNVELENLKFADSEVDGLDPRYLPLGDMPLKIVPAAKYLEKWVNLTNSRQRIFFHNLIKISLEICGEKEVQWGEEWGKILSLYFSLIVGKSIDFNSRCTSWASKEGIRNSLAFRRPSIVWDHCEINPLASKGSGTLSTVTRNILRGLSTAVDHLSDTPGSIEIHNESIFDLTVPRVDLVITDPPYADDVQYSELSDFFYVWEHLILGKYFPDKPNGITPKIDDLSANKIDRTIELMQLSLSIAFEKINKFLFHEGRIALFFANGSFEAWSSVINSLRNNQFQIHATFPVHTESKDNVIALGKSSFMTSTLIYATKRHKGGSVFFEEIQSEMAKYVSSRITDFLQFNFKGSDLAMACLGPALEVLSSYDEIESISGRFDVENILQLTSEILINELLGGSLVGRLDHVTQSYLYARLSGQEKMSYDAIQILAKSIGADINLIRSSTIFLERITGKHVTFLLQDYQTDRNLGKSLVDLIHKGFLLSRNENNRDYWSDIQNQFPEVRDVLKLIKYGIRRGNMAPKIDKDAIRGEKILTTYFKVL